MSCCYEIILSREKMPFRAVCIILAMTFTTELPHYNFGVFAYIYICIYIERERESYTCTMRPLSFELSAICAFLTPLCRKPI